MLLISNIVGTKQKNVIKRSENSPMTTLFKKNNNNNLFQNVFSHLLILNMTLLLSHHQGILLSPVRGEGQCLQTSEEEPLHTASTSTTLDANAILSL